MILALGGFIGWFVIAGPLNSYWRTLINRASPQMILVLGGDADRERVGVQLAKQMRLPLLMSSGTNREYAQWLIESAGVPSDQVELDYRARDTLGNFTSLVDDLQRRGINHILVVTSVDHLPRAMAVGQVVAGSRAIRLTGVPVACEPRCQHEGIQKRIGDWLRAVAWVFTGTDLKEWLIREGAKALNPWQIEPVQLWVADLDPTWR